MSFGSGARLQPSAEHSQIPRVSSVAERRTIRHHINEKTGVGERGRTTDRLHYARATAAGMAVAEACTMRRTWVRLCHGYALVAVTTVIFVACGGKDSSVPSPDSTGRSGAGGVSVA